MQNDYSNTHRGEAQQQQARHEEHDALKEHERTQTCGDAVFSVVDAFVVVRVVRAFIAISVQADHNFALGGVCLFPVFIFCLSPFWPHPWETPR